MYLPNLKFVALPVPEITAIVVLGWGCDFCEPPILKKGWGWDRSKERRFRDIAAFVLQHATFPTPPLISPEFPQVPIGVGGWPLGYEERRCWANCPCN